MVMCEENVSQLESGAQIAEAGEEDGKKRFSNEIEKEVRPRRFVEVPSRHRRDSCPSDEVMGVLFSSSRPFGPRRGTCSPVVASMA